MTVCRQFGASLKKKEKEASIVQNTIKLSRRLVSVCVCATEHAPAFLLSQFDIVCSGVILTFFNLCMVNLWELGHVTSQSRAPKKK